MSGRGICGRKHFKVKWMPLELIWVVVINSAPDKPEFLSSSCRGEPAHQERLGQRRIKIVRRRVRQETPKRRRPATVLRKNAKLCRRRKFHLKAIVRTARIRRDDICDPNRHHVRYKKIVRDNEIFNQRARGISLRKRNLRVHLMFEQVRDSSTPLGTSK